MPRKTKAKYPAAVDVVLYDLDNGYPRGGVGIEEKGTKILDCPSGVYKPTHACEWLLGEGWPGETIVSIRGSRTNRPAFGPMPLWVAAGHADKQMSMKLKQDWPGQHVLNDGTPRPVAAPHPKKGTGAPRLPVVRKEPRAPGGQSFGGVKRPLKDGICKTLWEIIDRFDGDKAKVVGEAIKLGIKESTAGANLAAWKRYKKAGGQ